MDYQTKQSQTKPSTTFQRDMWLHENGNYDRLRENLQAIDWDELLMSNCIDTCIHDFNNIIISEAKKCKPFKRITIRQKDPPWMTNSFKKLIRKQSLTYKFRHRLGQL